MNRKEFLATIIGASVAAKSVKPEKMVLYDDGYGKSLVPESVANGNVVRKKESLVEACERIRKEAEALADKNYPFHPGGKLIGRATGHLTFTKKND